MSTPDRDEIEHLLGQDVDELTALLGQADPDAEDALYSFSAARAAGEQLLQRVSGALHQSICDDWGYCERSRTASFRDDVELAVAVGAVLTTVIGSLPVSVVAAILVKRGLNAFCECPRDE
jgi:hypothetical protein